MSVCDCVLYVDSVCVCVCTCVCCVYVCVVCGKEEVEEGNHCSSLPSGFHDYHHPTPPQQKLGTPGLPRQLEGVLKTIQFQYTHSAGTTWGGGSSCKNVEGATALCPSSVSAQPFSWDQPSHPHPQDFRCQDA